MTSQVGLIIDDQPVNAVVTRYEEHPEGWVAEAQLSEAPTFRSGATVLWGERRGFVSRIEADTQMIDVTRGSDWAVPARWEPSEWRELTPGRTSYTLSIRGTR